MRAGTTAIRLSPEDPEAYYNLAIAQADSGQTAMAIANYKAAIARSPNHLMANNNLGTLLSQAGEFTEAEYYLRQAIAIKPDFINPHYNLATIHKYQAQDSHRQQLEALAAKADSLTQQDQAKVWFALGKANEDCKEYPQAFEAYRNGNQNQAASIKFDHARLREQEQQIRKRYCLEYLTANKPTHRQGAEAVFIVGMPRAGSTLVEQILHAHPDCHGAGEIRTLGLAIERNLGQGKTAQASKTLDYTAIGKDYLNALWELAPEAKHISNKMPANFAHLGLIQLALPDAKIIHVQRHPMDTLFSNFSKLYSEGVYWSYSFEGLACYYRYYRAVMDHWQQVLPPNTILSVNYETLIEDPRAQIARILDFIGVGWSDECLNFHKSDRTVKTASVAQVRKPIYKSSSARWKRFENALMPLHDLISDLLPD
ncbi:hypothetical protein Mag101_08460 [Microbulbifer agarilyticus]|uniref:Uncharacterized protein n=1 Tax=Microbulbifer agarilyticus TaxID=260552 RepID=A0A1Q2M4K5_9GAMM|nr:tetratricopeptide repeat-containing sulfotransferase family protein [Microbulbifer agarilyticus]AQQ67665.1 hypothetical protein Mag101_08460 [Microbulbifer agarilyticus]